MQTTQTRYVSAQDTAKLIRADLKRAFPGVRFSVRIKRGGASASARITWTDGPTARQVERIACHYQSSDYDPYRDVWGSLTRTDADDQPVHYGTNHVFCSRRLSVALLQRIANDYATTWQQPTPQIEEPNEWRGAQCIGPSARIGTLYIHEQINRRAQNTTADTLEYIG